MPEQIKVAFVGCTHPHIFPRVELLRAEPDVTLVGCYDPDSSLTAALERDYRLKAYSSPEELLDQPGVNWVIIEGWEPDNPRYVQLAAQRNQAVLLEKPGAPNLSEMHGIIDIIQAREIPFQVGYMLRFNSGVAHARRILSEGVLGPVTLVRLHAATPVGGSAERWQSVPGNLGGLGYTDACHLIDLMIYVLGMPQSVRGSILRLPSGPMVTAHGFKENTLSGLGATVQMPLGGLVHEDAVAAIFDYGDKLVTCDLTGWEAHPWVEAWRMEFYGTDGTLHVGIQPPWYKLYVRNPNHGYEAGWHNWDGFGVDGVGTSLVVDENYTGEIQHMLRRVREWDTDNGPWLLEAEGVITVLDALYRSDKSGGDVAIALRDHSA
jgi:predicted dehydrogenase